MPAQRLPRSDLPCLALATHGMNMHASFVGAVVLGDMYMRMCSIRSDPAAVTNAGHERTAPFGAIRVYGR